jgi:hypothetical protein
MIEMKEAVKNAMAFALELYDKEKLDDFLLEEVELSEDEKYWLITIGFNLGKTQTRNPLVGITEMTSRPVRSYKLIKVDADTGKPLSMKIRKI